MTTQTSASSSESVSKDWESKIHDTLMKIFVVLAAFVGELFACGVIIPKSGMVGTASMFGVAAFTVVFVALAMFAKTPEIRRKATRNAAAGVLISAVAIMVIRLT
jgi:hypothetical protein